MKWRAGWPYLAAGTGCAVLLLVVVTVIALKARRETEPLPLPLGEPQSVAVFPADFGRLDELVPSAGGVAPIPVDVVPVEHAPEYQEAAWLNAQDPAVFTLQVLAARDEEVVKRFLAAREDRADFAYFIYPQQDGVWFVLTTGRYATHELAASVAEGKDFGSLSTRAFPRRMSVYQEALRVVPPAPASSSGTTSTEP